MFHHFACLTFSLVDPFQLDPSSAFSVSRFLVVAWLIISLFDPFLRVSVTCAVGLYVIHLMCLRMPSCVWLIGSKVVGTVVFLRPRR